METETSTLRIDELEHQLQELLRRSLELEPKDRRLLRAVAVELNNVLLREVLQKRQSISHYDADSRLAA